MTQSDEITKRLGISVPLIVAPMAGGPSSLELVASVCQAGALGSVGAAYWSGSALTDFVDQLRRQTEGPFAINLFVPEKDPQISPMALAKAIQQTEGFRKELGLPAPHLVPPYQESFDHQFEALLRAKPKVFSFVFGIPKPEVLQAARKEGIFIIGTATTLEEALALQDAEVDAITLQGVEAGGHRGIFDPKLEDPEISALSLLEVCHAKVRLPLISAGGIMTREHIQKALEKGAQAVQMGTAFLACREAGTPPPYRERLLASADRQTKLTRAFSGRLARGMINRFMIKIDQVPEAILPFPAQNALTRDIRTASAKKGMSDFLSLWAGTGKGPLWTGKAADLISNLFAPLPSDEKEGVLG